MGDTEVWQSLPSEHKHSVWRDTERTFWDRYTKTVEKDRAALTQQFHRETTELRAELDRLNVARPQLRDRRHRLVQELSILERDISRVSDAFHNNAKQLAVMEDRFNRVMDERMKPWKDYRDSMIDFFREKHLNDRSSEPKQEQPKKEPEVTSMPTPENSTSTDNLLVNIKDADGRIVGPIERIDPWNPWVESIQDLPVRRSVVIRRGRRFSQEHLNAIYERTEGKGVKWLACMIQATGEIQTKRCQSCEKNQGAFENCVIVGGEMFPKCGNCEWNRQGCHQASGEWIDMQAAQDQARRKKLSAPSTPTTEKESEVQRNSASESPRPMLPKPVDQRPLETLDAAARAAAEELAQQVRLKEPRSIYGSAPTEALPHPGLTPPPQGVEDRRIAQMALAKIAGMPDQSSPRLPPISSFVDPVRHVRAEPQSQPMHPREMAPQHVPLRHHLTSHPQERRPLPQEPTSFNNYSMSMHRRMPSFERRSNAASKESSPQPASQVSDEPLPEITLKDIALRDDGVVYTHPECMEGVPVAKIDGNHPYWESHWKDVKADITRQWNVWKEKHQTTIEQEAKGEKNGSSKYQVGRQVNRGAKILEFLENGEISPYQLLAKRFLHTSKGGITSYDTLFRLAETLSELAKFNLDVTPVTWLRQRLHEIYLIEGPNFNMPRTVHHFYHDKKLSGLRAKNGFRNIGRPSGKGIGMTGTVQTTTGPLGKRKNMHFSSDPHQQTYEATFINSSPGIVPTPRFRNIITSDHNFGGAQKRRKSETSDKEQSSRPGSRESSATFVSADDNADEGTSVSTNESVPAQQDRSATVNYTSDVESELLTNDDFRVEVVKTSQYASSASHRQYMRLIRANANSRASLEHRVLTGNGSDEKWTKQQAPVNFSIRFGEVSKLEFNVETLKARFVARPVGFAAAGGKTRRDVLVAFKRASTLERLLKSCGVDDGLNCCEISKEEMEIAWGEVEAEVELDGQEELVEA